jgi:DNA-binding beta-propeller fold protein YncE
MMMTSAPQTHAQTLERVYVLNQGAFMQGNASITAYDPATGEVQQNVFQQANERPIGDIAQHSALMNGKLYVLISNSNKLEIVNPETFVAETTIFVDDFGGSSPTWIQQVSETKAYISNLTGTTVSILDLESDEITGSIEVGPNPEGIAVTNGKAYIALTEFGEGQEIAIVDITGDSLIETLQVHDNPRFPFVAEDGLVWVLSTGNYGFGDLPESFGQLRAVDPETDTVVETIELGGKPGQVQYDAAADQVYVLNGGIQQVDLGSGEVTEEFFSETAYFSLGLWQGDESAFYAGFAPDFSSAGRVDILNAEGDVMDEFTTGTGPGFVQFVEGDEPVSVNPGNELAAGFELHQNYPNPFNPSTQIEYSLPEAAEVQLEVFNMMGQRVATLVSEQQTAGSYSVRFNAGTLASGVYLYRLSAGQEVITQKMTLLK